MPRASSCTRMMTRTRPACSSVGATDMEPSLLMFADCFECSAARAPAAKAGGSRQKAVKRVLGAGCWVLGVGSEQVVLPNIQHLTPNTFFLPPAYCSVA